MIIVMSVNRNEWMVILKNVSIILLPHIQIGLMHVYLELIRQVIGGMSRQRVLASFIKLITQEK